MAGGQYDYDTIILGAGIAGLYCAREILKKNPRERLVLCEKYKKLGGRTITFSKDLGGRVGRVQWEMGAGRISLSHKMLIGLIKEYGLHTAPISERVDYRETGASEYEENRFEPAIDVLLRPLMELPPEVQGTHTLKELLVAVHGAAETQKWMNRFPYHAEVVVMRADMALREFREEFKSHEGYVVSVEGLSALVEAMTADVKKRGGVILNQYECVNVAEGVVECLAGPWKDGADRPLVALTGRRIICALHANALRQIGGLKKIPFLKMVAMEPLFRIYAVFPHVKGAMWFDGLARIVTTNPIRYFLPINVEKGTAMVSYTDSKFAEHYMKIQNKGGDTALEKEVMRDLRDLFPEKRIPKPLLFKGHPWTEGVSYWLPGHYDPAEVSLEALQPFPREMPHVYVCGESFSVRQGWAEGALEHAEVLLKKLGVH